MQSWNFGRGRYAQLLHSNLIAGGKFASLSHQRLVTRRHSKAKLGSIGSFEHWPCSALAAAVDWAKPGGQGTGAPCKASMIK